jgi:hypothetical protein
LECPLKAPTGQSNKTGKCPLMTIAGNSHFATILVIKLKADLNPKDLSVIVVSYVLKGQER